MVRWDLGRPQRAEGLGLYLAAVQPPGTVGTERGAFRLRYEAGVAARNRGRPCWEWGVEKK